MRILLTGASGQLGAYLIDRLVDIGHEVLAWSGTQISERRGVRLTPVDLTDSGATAEALERADPEAVIHAAAISSAEAVRLDPVRALAINVDATARLAHWCGQRNRRLVFTSTDLVFDGSRPWNREVDPADPVLAYGRTKKLAEPSVLAIPKGVVARVSLLFGPSRTGRPAFFDHAVAAFRNGESRAFFEDEYRTPLDLATAALIFVRLAESDLAGLYHVAGPERMSRYRLMERAALALGFNPSLVVPNCREDANFLEPRPADVSLDTTRLEAALPELRRPSIEETLRAG